MIYSDFVFSGLRDDYFHNLKTLVKPMFEFDNINISALADLILLSKEDVGTVVKNEDEDETNNKNVDLFSIFTMVPLTYFFNKAKTNESLIATQILECIKGKVEKYSRNVEEKVNGLNILANSRIGLLVNERFINMPQEAIPISFNFLIKEIGECREDESYDGKFDLDYIVIISKYVKKLFPNDSKKIKKTKFEEKPNDEILHYKYETEHFMRQATINITYKIPYEQLNLDYLENKNEPQYYSVLFVKSENFLSVINYLNNNK